MSTHPTVNDELPGCLASGRVKVTSDVQRLTSTGVVFTDGSVEKGDVFVLFVQNCMFVLNN